MYGFMLLFFIALVLNASAQNVESNVVAEQKAFELVAQKYDLNKVDVFTLTNDSSTDDSNMFYKYFIDEEPMKGWEHKCAVVKVSRFAIPGKPISSIVQELRFPPDGRLEARHLMPRDLRYANHKPVVRPNPQRKSLSTKQQEEAKRTYAIILSGGVDSTANYNRYWNDCSFLYQTLKYRYGIPSENIVPIMSDGNNPGKDMKVEFMDHLGFSYVSQPLDLDNDGIDDIEYAATRANITAVLQELCLKMDEYDHLLFFVADHGAFRNQLPSEAYICLWGKASFHDKELARLLKPFTDKSITVNVVLGQCHSGGFIDDLTDAGCVVATACMSHENSGSFLDKPYDIFLYNWTSAINGEDPFGNPVSADYDQDGFVSMTEAFRYAKENSPSDEHPQYSSNPESLGEALAFNRVPRPDLFVRDNYDDDGLEPNLTTDIVWDSPDIWLRNSDDDRIYHDNPQYSPDNMSKTVYVKVHNRGNKDYIVNPEGNAKAKYIHLHWAKSSTAWTDDAWSGNEYFWKRPIRVPTGGRICEPICIPGIPAGESVTVKAIWQMDKEMFTLPQSDELDGQLFGVLAEIKDDNVQEDLNDTLLFDPKVSNRIALKNLTVLESDGTDATNMASVFVRNPFSSSKKYSLEIAERVTVRSPGGKSLFDVATVELTMTPSIYQAWKRGGSKASSNIVKPTEDSSRTFSFTSDGGMLMMLDLDANAIDRVSVKLNIHSRSDNALGTTYIFDLIQRDEYGHIMSGAAFSYTEPAKFTPIWPNIPVDIMPAVNGNVEMEAILPEEATSVVWTDKKDKCIGSGERIIVRPTRTNNEITVYAYSDEEVIAKGFVELNPTMGIKSVSSSSAGSGLLVELFAGTGSGNSEIIVSPIDKQDVQSVQKHISADEILIPVNVEALPAGLYAVALMVDGKVIDNIKFKND